jgi:trehalose 6-phosphate synthase/phosphatase
MSRLLIISNRLPLNLSKEKGQIRVGHSVGGLATGIDSVHKSRESLWIGWPGYSVQKLQKEEKKQIFDLLAKEKCHPVFLTSYDIKQYYSGFCNNTIWPLFHYFNLYTKYDQSYWNSYKNVNEKFRDAVLEVAKPDDVFWIQDYHLMLLPEMIRQKLPKAKIGFFLHIPFPSYEIFRLLPWRSEILIGLLGADLVGFHTYDYVRHFFSSVRRVLGYEHSLSEIQTGERLVKVELFPMGIDYDRFYNTASSAHVGKEVARIRGRVGTQKILLSFDRLDYTKGIPLRLEALDAFLNKKAEYRGKITFYLVTVPSRSNVAQYQILKKQIDELVGRINGKYATTEWMPVRYFSHFLPFSSLVTLYSVADVGLVTPLRDGMNLMAKEFIASKVNGTGTLILSEMTGAAQELGEAIIVNPNNQEALINAIEKSLTTSQEEQQKQNRIMQNRLKRYDIKHWIEDFLSTLDKAWLSQLANMERFLTSAVKKELAKKYSVSKRRLILLDYDGTLVPFADTPENAKPTTEVLNFLKKLSEDPSNEVVIISGRKRQSLIKWFNSLDVGYIGEHGAWIKERSGKVHTPRALSNDWKKDILPMLELYTDRTPGALIEEKEYSVVWHYRKAEPILGFLRANQLKDDLTSMTSNLGLAVVEGNKVVEIKNAIINKGRAAQLWLSKKYWDFIIAIGDDKTDEDLFEVLPSTAFSFKVGVGSTKARFNLSSQSQVLPLLWSYIKNIKTLTIE